jgi:hypothetical protein
MNIEQDRNGKEKASSRGASSRALCFPRRGRRNDIDGPKLRCRRKPKHHETRPAVVIGAAASVDPLDTGWTTYTFGGKS